MFPEGWAWTFVLDVLVSSAVSFAVLFLVYYLRKRYSVRLLFLALLLVLGFFASVAIGMALGLRGAGGGAGILVLGGWMLSRFYREDRAGTDRMEG